MKAALFAFFSVFAVSYAATGKVTKLTTKEERDAFERSFLQFKTGRDFDASEHQEIELEGGQTNPDAYGLPLFTSSFTAQGKNYPFTMIGNAPASGGTANIPVAVVPIRVTFNDVEGGPFTFDPTEAASNLMASPFFNNADFPNQNGQWVDSLQRCAFASHSMKNNWHIQLTATLMPTLDWEIYPDEGNVVQVSEGNYLGQIRGPFVIDRLHKFFKQTTVPVGTLVVFVCHDVAGVQFAGFHNTVSVAGKDWTYAFGAWLTPGVFKYSDVLVFSHELAEWANDPLLHNRTPDVMAPPKGANSFCSGLTYLEVGDPISNFGNIQDFDYTAIIPLNGFDYSLQNVVTWEWFTGKYPSTACNGWYTFPNGNAYKHAAQFCPNTNSNN